MSQVEPIAKLDICILIATLQRMASNFVFRSVWPADLFAARNLITKTFLNKEPLTSHVHLSEAGFHSIYDQLLGSLDYKTSIVALPEPTSPISTHEHDVLACLVASPFDAPLDESKVDRAALPILALIHSLDDWFKAHIMRPRSIPASRVLHLTMGATRAGYAGKGLLTGMMREWERQAGDGRWDVAVAECTSIASRRVLRDKMGWVEGKVVRYAEFETDGERPFKALEGEAAVLYKELPG